MTRRIWWPSGHHLPEDEIAIWTFPDPALQAALERAEKEADYAREALERARLQDACPSDLDKLSVSATQARLNFYETLTMDLAP